MRGKTRAGGRSGVPCRMHSSGIKTSVKNLIISPSLIRSAAAQTCPSEFCQCMKGLDDEENEEALKVNSLFVVRVVLLSSIAQAKILTASCMEGWTPFQCLGSVGTTLTSSSSTSETPLYDIRYMHSMGMFNNSAIFSVVHGFSEVFVLQQLLDSMHRRTTHITHARWTCSGLASLPGASV
ncbi:hypothetical protein BS17DRAFT_111556 [Gyrodon lividus]|nr:hypothetical protein BS17DRAFT_111556 [Gyrodon lividus]